MNVLSEISTTMVAGQSAADSGRKAGFSLVEVTLALMVVAVGILSVMSLFPAGLDQNVRSIADTRMAFFAEDVFNGLQAWSQDNWDNLNQAEIPVAAADRWEQAADKAWPTDFKEINGAWPTIWTNNYFIAATPPSEIEKFALRFSYNIITNHPRNTIKGVTLFVWSGEFGTTNNPTIFYSEFFTNWNNSGP